ncbi:MAG: formyl transferase [Candidatus Niyogibacteria bacterium]|nr:MAG: formyl transferase [Candidatus Niyogibacteria bacterium]
MKKRKLKNVIFLGRKSGASEALKFLIESDIKVLCVVAPENERYSPSLKSTSENYGIPVYTGDKEIYRMIERKDPAVGDVDLVISYLFWKRIKAPLINLGHLGCVNFHPAPLPDYKGRAGYNTAIIDQRKDFGVSAHFVDSEEFDAGPIIKVLRFPINQEKETALSLEQKSQKKLSELFREVIKIFREKEEIPTTANVGGLYLSSEELEKLKIIDPAKDAPELIDRKIRAFFFPPYPGAKIEIGGRYFTLVNEQILDYLHRLIAGEEKNRGD